MLEEQVETIIKQTVVAYIAGESVKSIKALVDLLLKDEIDMKPDQLWLWEALRCKTGLDEVKKYLCHYKTMRDSALDTIDELLQEEAENAE